MPTLPWPLLILLHFLAGTSPFVQGLPPLCFQGRTVDKNLNLRGETNMGRSGRWESIWRLKKHWKQFESQDAPHANKEIYNSNWATMSKTLSHMAGKIHLVSQLSVIKQIKHYTFLCSGITPSSAGMFITFAVNNMRRHSQMLDLVQKKCHPSSFHNEQATLLPIAMLMGDSLQGGSLKTVVAMALSDRNPSVASEAKLRAINELENLLTASGAKKTAKSQKWRCPFWMVCWT